LTLIEFIISGKVLGQKKQIKFQLKSRSKLCMMWQNNFICQSGKWQKPWDGQLQYDYQLWIDSDIVFDSNAFWKLCDLALKGDESVELNSEFAQYTDEQLYEMGDEDEEVRRERVRRLNRNGSPIVSGWYVTEIDRADWYWADSQQDSL